MKDRVFGASSLVLVAFAWAAWGQTDMPGSKDHPLLPRVTGTYIVGYAQSTYDEGVFVNGMEDRELQTVAKEGKRTRIMYFGTPDQSPLMFLRNYQSAFEKLGTVNEVFSCRRETCYTNFADVFTWNDDNRIPNVSEEFERIYANSDYYRDQSYWYGTVTTTAAVFHISLYSAVFTDENPVESVRGLPSLHIEIVELTDFEPTLTVVTAAEMTSSINQRGYIALYGVQFDLDSAALRAESEPTLREIAAAMTADKALRLYVVGHTDNQGTLQHNQDLSQRRAAAVVDALVDSNGVARDRLVPLGAGLMAPKASNDSEEGRSLNRRVELVKF